MLKKGECLRDDEGSMPMHIGKKAFQGRLTKDSATNKIGASLNED